MFSSSAPLSLNDRFLYMEASTIVILFGLLFIQQLLCKTDVCGAQRALYIMHLDSPSRMKAGLSWWGKAVGAGALGCRMQHKE